MPMEGIEPGGCPPECDDGHIAFKRDGLDFVTPCPVCRPERYAALKNGCYAFGHDRDHCPKCQARMSGRPSTPLSTAPRRRPT